METPSKKSRLNLFQSPRKRNAVTRRVMDHFEFSHEEVELNEVRKFYKCKICDGIYNGTSDSNLKKTHAISQASLQR